MGANLAIIGFSDKIKTAQQALKDADRRGDEDRYENGHSYSGGIGMLHWRVVNRVFDTVEDFEKLFVDGDRCVSDKGDGIIAQVRVIRSTKPLEKAKKDLGAAQMELSNATYNMGPYREKKATPAKKRSLQAKVDKLELKVRTITLAQAAKSTKTRFMGGGWCSS